VGHGHGEAMGAGSPKEVAIGERAATGRSSRVSPVRERGRGRGKWKGGGERWKAIPCDAGA